LGAAYDAASGTFVVPGWTTAVYVLPQSEAMAEPELISEEPEAAPEEAAAEEEMHDAAAEEHADEEMGHAAEAEPVFPSRGEGVERPLTIWLVTAGIGLIISLIIALLFNRRQSGEEPHH
ncbi:MAG: hypothetical protein KC419_18385, partial [Anaerolineales bacterium]|nr:hypothetical protein [Anaerolineales bacterium]